MVLQHGDVISLVKKDYKGWSVSQHVSLVIAGWSAVSQSYCNKSSSAMSHNLIETQHSSCVDEVSDGY